MLAASTSDYLNHLQTKGFSFREDTLGFIEFGKIYTASSDKLVNLAIEITLKAQYEFDGSFYIAILEMFKAHNIKSKKAAYKLIKERNIL
ncbi:hypothetical protein M670_03678 [Schinkia azotoformans MEV2011]|uniref:Uncharacterized protein n=2 Tax=Schinkia azotoformans TaxID=1454 RepID=K6CU14_SCHAZ|nr:DUF6123 family protein [Schinkia azotoformans]EKN63732.1 hypothetical protein BAZO_16054 [Schinkia azotoformans LMG 9581]KEF37086.1 hypothetical protein M670_03678 [Schinkia azotoformans MEV2011]MEC1640945.1 DUF6123 family protein [Schinkia azotoformans]MEC1694310.1 DUF6123 family protein [Schinkia azotoformans]MEC1718035.1 DUF6123 family protein [Schinkia azotoformans]